MANPESDNYVDTREKQLERLVTKIVEPMRRAHQKFCEGKSDAELIENWSQWYISIENTILWNVEYPREAEMLDKLYDTDMRLEEIREHYKTKVAVVAERLVRGLKRKKISADSLTSVLQELGKLLEAPTAGVAEELREERDRLLEAIKLHHSQKADDLCVMDDNDLYHAAGLPSRDNHIGDPEAMLANCKRFIAQRCQAGGPWKSYAELEAEVEKLKKFKEYVHRRLDEAGVPHDPDPEHNKQHGCRIEGRLNWLFAAVKELNDRWSATGSSVKEVVAAGKRVLKNKQSVNTLVLKHLHAYADVYKIFKAEQFEWPTMRALAKAVNFDEAKRP